MPDRLYKYRSLSAGSQIHTEKIITGNQLFFPAAEALNDPFECRAYMSIGGTPKQLRETFEQVFARKFPGVPGSVLKKMAENATAPHVDLRHVEREGCRSWIAQTKRETGICCFSEKRDDILMYSHYGDCHRGICLEFDASDKSSLFGQARPVIYREDYPVLELHSYRQGTGEAGEKMFLTKFPGWSYEKEWRILRTPPGPEIFAAHLLIGIIFGCQVTDDQRQLVRSWVGERTTSVQLYQAKIRERNFGVDIVSMC